MGLIAGCASTPPPDESMAKAGLAIESARQSEAIVHAPLELQLAEEKLTAARKAVAEEDMDRGRRLAEEAFVDAKLADEKAQTAKTKQLVQELRDSIEALRQEIERGRMR